MATPKQCHLDLLDLDSAAPLDLEDSEEVVSVVDSTEAEAEADFAEAETSKTEEDMAGEVDEEASDTKAPDFQEVAEADSTLTFQPTRLRVLKVVADSLEGDIVALLIATVAQAVGIRAAAMVILVEEIVVRHLVDQDPAEATMSR